MRKLFFTFKICLLHIFFCFVSRANDALNHSFLDNVDRGIPFCRKVSDSWGSSSSATTRNVTANLFFHQGRVGDWQRFFSKTEVDAVWTGWAEERKADLGLEDVQPRYLVSEIHCQFV